MSDIHQCFGGVSPLLVQACVTPMLPQLLGQRVIEYPIDELVHLL